MRRRPQSPLAAARRTMPPLAFSGEPRAIHSHAARAEKAAQEPVPETARPQKTWQTGQRPAQGRTARFDAERDFATWPPRPNRRATKTAPPPHRLKQKLPRPERVDTYNKSPAITG